MARFFARAFPGGARRICAARAPFRHRRAGSRRLSDGAARELDLHPVAAAESGHAMNDQTAREWPQRAFFGVLLSAAALAATWAGGFYFAGYIAIVALAAAREWHRMAGGQKFALEIAFTTG